MIWKQPPERRATTLGPHGNLFGRHKNTITIISLPYRSFIFVSSSWSWVQERGVRPEWGPCSREPVGRQVTTLPGIAFVFRTAVCVRVIPGRVRSPAGLFQYIFCARLYEYLDKNHIEYPYCMASTRNHRLFGRCAPQKRTTYELHSLFSKNWTIE